ncbi:M20 aminoacylase family protein [Nitratireductor basaltis]|uniref:Hippurate hydrolase n=1 Tax=Nitratireductor basaltis TaxID=472175 RepID=A0A084U555_9HYPH|nr:M20 aminoacylase family protein [Nitratireductor basaltis]KFB08091.1 Hippurate hydrolase [Nitratireductor basaltis]
MPVLPKIAEYADELTAIRRDFHQHPEIGFEEVRTSGIVAEKLKGWGIEVHTGLARTGVVGVLKGKGEGSKTVGLRADMDALPMDEQTNLPYASKNPGRFHGCGHDSHTTMLLGAARYLAETRDFSGTAVFIFQPAEEGLGGARTMLKDGLFDKFPCDEIYGMHNNPLAEPNKVGVKPGAAMAGASFFDITINGVGSHGAMPHHSKDPIVIASALVQSLQSIVSRNVPAVDTAVLSVTQVHSGSAYNVVPDKAVISGTIRYFKDEVMELIHHRVRSLCNGMAQAYEISIDVDLRNIFDVLMNDPALSEAYLDAAREIVGAENVEETREVATGSEDFADMLKVVPGAYCTLGHKGTVPVHNPGFILDDDMLPVGSSIMARIVEKRLAS